MTGPEPANTFVSSGRFPAKWIPKESVGVNADFFSRLVEPLVRDDPVDFREDRVILSEADVLPGMDFRSELADDDGSRGNGLAAEDLDAPPLTVAVPSVPGASLSFLVCHDILR